MESEEESKIFEKRIDNFVRNRVKGGLTRFDHIVLSLPGVYPSVALSSLQRLAANNKVPNTVLTAAKDFVRDSNASNSSGSINDQLRPGLPLPHPLDFEWRFGDEALDRLLGLSIELSPKNEPIVLLGVPSVLNKTRNQKNSRRFLLLEANKSIINYYEPIKESIFNCDLTCDVLPKISASVVICDPPWYVEYFKHFLWAAKELLCEGGYLLLSTPPVGTRPNIINEWKIVLNFSKQLGFRLTRFDKNSLPYVSPLFEINSLRAEGIINVPKEWRRSDLAIFVLDKKNIAERPNPINLFSNWDELTYRGVRTKFKCVDIIKESVSPALVSFLPDDIIPSVSRRDCRRKLANVWTSGNRIFKCDNPTLAKQILSFFVNTGSVTETVNKYCKLNYVGLNTDTINKLVLKFIDIIKIEEQEYNYYSNLI